MPPRESRPPVREFAPPPDDDDPFPQSMAVNRSRPIYPDRPQRPSGGFRPRPERGFGGPRGGGERGPGRRFDRGPDRGFSRGPDRGPRQPDAGRGFNRFPDRGPRPDRPFPQGDRGFRGRPEGGAPRGFDRPRHERPTDRGRPDRPFARRDERGPSGRPAGGPPRSFDRPRGERPTGGAGGGFDPRRGPRGGFDERRGPRRFDRGPAPRAEAPVATVDAADRLPRDPREAALRILFAAETRGAFTDRLLDGEHATGADDRDRALLHELVKGTLRWRGRVDWVLDQLVHVGLANVQPWIRNVLRLGAYQILFLDRIPPHAAVDESVKLAHRHGHPGTAGLVNSVLRRLVEEKDRIAIPEGDDVASLAVWGSHPEWLVTRWLERFGVEATRALLLANNRSAAVGLRVNPLRVTRQTLVDKLTRDGYETRIADLSPDLVWIEGRVAPGALAPFREGWCTAQDESEALVGRLVGPAPHERLLDLCAAPGGKCTHLAELMGDEGEVWAMERAPERVASLEATVARLGCQAVHVVKGDGRTYTFPMPFDRVLVDAPCSGLGVLARRADARWRKGPELLAEMPPVQLELLAAGARRVRPGGVLVYSVCSFEPEETDWVVQRFLMENPGFTLESASGHVPDAVVDERGFLRVLPHVHGCDGAFAARFRRA